MADASIATLILIGGVADYLSVSAVLLGWVTVSAWRLITTSPLEDARADIAYVQHPAMALLLVVAGAYVRLSWWILLAAAAAVATVPVVALLIRTLHPRTNLRPLLPVTAAMFAVAVSVDITLLDSRLLPLLSVVVLVAATFDGVTGRRTEVAA
jgi:hypothetical protein